MVPSVKYLHEGPSQNLIRLSSTEACFHPNWATVLYWFWNPPTVWLTCQVYLTRLTYVILPFINICGQKTNSVHGKNHVTHVIILWSSSIYNERAISPLCGGRFYCLQEAFSWVCTELFSNLNQQLSQVLVLQPLYSFKTNWEFQKLLPVWIMYLNTYYIRYGNSNLKRSTHLKVIINLLHNSVILLINDK